MSAPGPHFLDVTHADIPRAFKRVRRRLIVAKLLSIPAVYACIELAIYLAGADPHERDRLGRLSVTREGLGQRDGMVFDACRGRGIPVAVSMAGGYGADVEETVDIHFETVRRAAMA